MLIFFANVHVIKRRQLIFHGICQFQFLDPPTHKKFGGGYKKMLIFFANVHVKRRQLIFHGILLTVDHHSEKKN